MYKKNGQLYYSPSDLASFMESPFASWMDRFSIEHADEAPNKDPVDELKSALAQKGYAQEEVQKSAFLQQEKTLLSIKGASADDKYLNTLNAMAKGIDVIVQARLQLDQFAGYADFLVKVVHSHGDQPSLLGNWHYEVWDSKLANTVKPSFVVQLCSYSEMLGSMQGVLPEFITIVLGSGNKERLRIRDYYSYYKSLKSSFTDKQIGFNADLRPDPADSVSWGDWSGYAKQILLDKDHLFQVAGITKGQIKRLNKAGIQTMQQLIEASVEDVLGFQPEIIKRLISQAKIQRSSERRDTPLFEILSPPRGEISGLALLPPLSPLDVFFDIEGYPLDKGGLEYLWGSTYFDEAGNRQFIDFWAHDQEQEKQCFQDFIAWVYKRWQNDPSMHIYHYANYEIAACQKLMNRYGVCEYEVDQLLRNSVFVDLYKVVKGGLLLGEPRYSIKNVERLYREKRSTEVVSGGESIIVYEQWRELHRIGEQGDTHETSQILKDIRDYNIDDCNSTQELVEWLRLQQKKHSISFFGKTDVIEPEVPEEITDRIKLRDRLLLRACAGREKDPAEASITENLAYCLEFHRRESKPIFWRLYDRLGQSHVELRDDLDCLAQCTRTEREAFKSNARARNLAYEYCFDATQEFKGAQKQFHILGSETESGQSAKVTFKSDDSDLENGLIVVQSKDEPPSIMSLVPDEYVNPNPIPQAIEQIAKDYENGDLSHGQSAILDFLARAKPRITNHQYGPIAHSQDPDQRLKLIIKAIANLDNSYLTIQGPPGAGKTYTGKYVIADLMKAGARVGIASNSHKAINNLLLSTAKYCKDAEISASFSCTKDNEPDLTNYGVKILKNSELVNHVHSSCVIGTTAWGFARDDMANQLDYLFVDEAGQVAIANLIAMSRSAKNLILMGDQMQLGQPSQSAHPADSGLSALDYLLNEKATIPADMGVFLGTTYRMHSQVNQFISEHIYEGKLHPHPDNDIRVIDVPDDYKGALNMSAGLVFIPVDHEGNTQASDEEVDKIKELAHELIGRCFHTGLNHPRVRAISWDDILFVAPYNHQVSKLRSALGKQAKIGSVDKFQGQEAPVVILSMCASDASESPRGMDFLLDKHRLNVAISRAQTLAIVVGNPRLAQTAVNQVDQLKLVSLFSSIALAV